MRSFDDVLLFSIKLDILKITRKDNSFDIYLSHSYAPAQLTPLVLVHSGNTEQGKCRLTNEYLFFLFFMAIGIMKKIFVFLNINLF